MALHADGGMARGRPNEPGGLHRPAPLGGRRHLTPHRDRRCRAQLPAPGPRERIHARGVGAAAIADAPDGRRIAGAGRRRYGGSGQRTREPRPRQQARHPLESRRNLVPRCEGPGRRRCPHLGLERRLERDLARPSESEPDAGGGVDAGGDRRSRRPGRSRGRRVRESRPPMGDRYAERPADRPRRRRPDRRGTQRGGGAGVRLLELRACAEAASLHSPRYRIELGCGAGGSADASTIQGAPRRPIARTTA